jgi:antitoxin CcdA
MRMSATNRKATSVSLDPLIVADAKAHGINVSRACETGLVIELKKAREKRWRSENAEAIAAANAYVERYGLPLEAHRLF